MLLGTCSHCGRSSSYPVDSVAVDSSSSAFLSEEEEIISILAEAKRLNNFLLQVHEYRSKQLQRLNALRSTTRIFPAEVLSLIFQNCLPQLVFDSFGPIPANLLPPAQTATDPYPHPQVAIFGVVCKRWRQVAYSTPRLWQAAEIKIRRDSIENRAHLIQLYLTNVGDTSLSLKLSSAPSPPVPTPFPSISFPSDLSEAQLLPILHVIWEGAGKIKWLTSTLNLGSWIALLSRQFKKLEGLALFASPRPWAVTGCPGPQVTPWSTIPHLKHVVLAGHIFRVPRDSPSIPSITILNLDQRDLDVCVRLLLLCPNLVEYRIRPTTEVESVFDVPLLDHLVTFHHMKIFQVDCVLQPPFLPILPHLRLPALKQLGLGTTDRDPMKQLGRLLTFLYHLPLSWSTLSLNRQLTETASTLDLILSAIPDHVSNLSFTYAFTTPLVNVLHLLTKEDPVRGVPMSGLRYLHMQYFQQEIRITDIARVYRDPPLPSLSRTIWEMIQARKHEVNGDLLRLEMDNDHGADWKGLKHEYRLLIDEGLLVRIVVKGELVDCLQEIYNELDGGIV